MRRQRIFHRLLRHLRGRACHRRFQSGPGAANLINNGSWDPFEAPTSGSAGRLALDFNNGSPAPLVQTYGPNDNPAQANAAYTVNYANGRAVYVAPAAVAVPRLTGFLDRPAAMTTGTNRLVLG